MANELEVKTAEPAQSGLYHLIWRWHFYAGIFVAPFLIVLALTGALYLFQHEIEGVVYRNATYVAPSAAHVAPSIQEASVRASFPGAQIQRYTAPVAPDRAAEWTIIDGEGVRRVVFADPATGALTGMIEADGRVMDIVSRLHGELLAGSIGDYVVEFAACWAFVLLVTGVFLWWPRKARKGGVALPRLNAKGRSLLRDLHAVPFAWNALFVAFLILTGLPWSGFWGNQLAKLGTVSFLSAAMAPTPNFHSAPAAPSAHDHGRHQSAAAVLGEETARDLPWALRHVSMPLAAAQHGAHAAPIGVDRLVAIAGAHQAGGDGLRVLYPSAPDGVFTLSYVPDKAEAQRTLYVNPSNGAILGDIGWDQYSPLGKVVEFGVLTHLGRQFGLANQLLMLAVCLLMIASVVAGYWMWLKRRPAGRLGAPPAPAGVRAPVALIATAIALGVLFPLVGASILLICAWELVFGRKGAAATAA